MVMVTESGYFATRDLGVRGMEGEELKGGFTVVPYKGLFLVTILLPADSDGLHIRLRTNELFCAERLQAGWGYLRQTEGARWCARWFSTGQTQFTFVDKEDAVHWAENQLAQLRTRLKEATPRLPMTPDAKEDEERGYKPATSQTFQLGRYQVLLVLRELDDPTHTRVRASIRLPVSVRDSLSADPPIVEGLQSGALLFCEPLWGRWGSPRWTCTGDWGWRERSLLFDSREKALEYVERALMGLRRRLFPKPSPSADSAVERNVMPPESYKESEERRRGMTSTRSVRFSLERGVQHWDATLVAYLVLEEKSAAIWLPAEMGDGALHRSLLELPATFVGGERLAPRWGELGYNGGWWRMRSASFTDEIEMNKWAAHEVVHLQNVVEHERSYSTAEDLRGGGSRPLLRAQKEPPLKVTPGGLQRWLGAPLRNSREF